MADKWLNHVLGPTDPQGPQAFWLSRIQDHLAQKHRNKPFELVWPYTDGLHLQLPYVEEVFEQHFPFFGGKDQTSFRTEHGPLEGGKQAISGAQTSPLQFLHPEIITLCHRASSCPSTLAFGGSKKWKQAHSRYSRENGIWEKDVCSKSTKNREPRRGRGNLLTHLKSYFLGRTF